MAFFRYGAESSLRLEFAAGVVADAYGTPLGEPLGNLPVAIEAAFDDPLEYPPLRQTTTPGDRVLLALDRGVPQPAEVIAAVIRYLVRTGVGADGISILRTQASASNGAEDPCRLLDESLRQQITTAVHDPEDCAALAYLAANSSGEPILLNRLLTDADVVLPIGCLRGEPSTGYFGIHTAVFPSFSDQQTLSRFRRLDALGSDGPLKRELAGEVRQAAWWLGINFTLQLVPGAGDGVLNVVAGQSDAVDRRGRKLFDQAWRSVAARRASLVVAAIEGGTVQQTWENLGLALEAASELAEDSGAIAVCDLATPPGPGVQSLASARSRSSVLRHIRKDRPADALPAAQLAQALERDKVYLLSRLDPALVEDLDMIPLANGGELTRLARQHRSCIVLSNAPRAKVTLESEDS